MIKESNKAALPTVKPGWQEKLALFWQSNRQLIYIWLVIRVILLLIPFFAFQLLGNQAQLFGDNNPVGDEWTDRLVGSWLRWDGGWYATIATEGYQNEIVRAFYPLYPHLLRFGAFILGLGQINLINLGIAGILISSLAALTACILVYQLACLDYPTRVARLSVLYLLIFPMSFFMFAVYTESLFLALVAGAFYAARKQHWFLALVLTALAVLTKNQGILLTGALLVEYGQQNQWKPLKLLKPRLLYFGLPALAFGGWILFNAVTFNNPTQILTSNQKYWGRITAWPWQTFERTIGVLGDVFVTGESRYVNIVYELAFLIMLFILAGVGIIAWQRGELRLSYLVFFLLCLAQPLFFPSIVTPLISIPRFAVTIFPAFFLLAAAGRRRLLFHNLYLAISGCLLLLATALFSLGFWVA